MHWSSILVVGLCAASLAFGAILPAAPRSLPSGTVTCGYNQYNADELTQAINAAINYLQDGDLQDNYPHQFYDDEGITLVCSGGEPWYEYPILPDGSVYTSPSDGYLSPGPDRVIFTGDAVYCAVVTHTGALSRNGFVACDGD